MCGLYSEGGLVREWLAFRHGLHLRGWSGGTISREVPVVQYVDVPVDVHVPVPQEVPRREARVRASAEGGLRSSTFTRGAFTKAYTGILGGMRRGGFHNCPAPAELSVRRGCEGMRRPGC